MQIDITDLRFSHTPDGPVLFDGVSLRLLPGERVALMGPSGSGKTSLLSLLGGLIGSYGGSLRFQSGDGLTLERLAPEHIGWVFQTANVLGRRTALDNVALPLLARGRRRTLASKEADEMLDAIGLSHKKFAAARTLSGGERQRVCIARGLVGDPTLVLADEPTGQLDAGTTSTVLRSMFDALGSTSTLVMATHDPVVAQFCDRLIRIENGRLVE